MLNSTQSTPIDVYSYDRYIKTIAESIILNKLGLFNQKMTSKSDSSTCLDYFRLFLPK